MALWWRTGAPVILIGLLAQRGIPPLDMPLGTGSMRPRSNWVEAAAAATTLAHRRELLAAAGEDHCPPESPPVEVRA